MKKIIILSILYILPLACISQNQNINFITYEKYVSIKINGKTLLEINNTKGDHNKMNSLFNKQFQYKSITIPDCNRYLSHPDLKFNFFKESGGVSWDYELDYLKISSSNISVEIDGNIFKIGNTFNNPNNKIIINTTSGSVNYGIAPNSKLFFTKSENYFVIELKRNIIIGMSILFL